MTTSALYTFETEDAANRAAIHGARLATPEEISVAANTLSGELNRSLHLQAVEDRIAAALNARLVRVEDPATGPYLNPIVGDVARRIFDAGEAVWPNREQVLLQVLLVLAENFERGNSTLTGKNLRSEQARQRLALAIVDRLAGGGR